MIGYQLWFGTRWVEVSKMQYVAAERHAGLDNPDQPDEPATSAFGNADTGDWGATFDKPHQRRRR